MAEDLGDGLHVGAPLDGKRGKGVAKGMGSCTRIETSILKVAFEQELNGPWGEPAAIPAVEEEGCKVRA